jgi:DNA-binding NarL/FixJ family response regulator
MCEILRFTLDGEKVDTLLDFGLTVKEVARELGIPESTVRKYAETEYEVSTEEWFSEE